MLASALTQTVAQTGQHILSKSVTDRYLREANERMFKPHKLRVRLMKTGAVMKLLGEEMPGEKDGKWKKGLDATGRRNLFVYCKMTMIDDSLSNLKGGSLVS
jgi:hypothetical protein